MDRRTFLARSALGLGGATGLAGCLGDQTGSGGSDGSDPSTDATGADDGTSMDDTGSPTPTWEDGPAFGDHPATKGIRQQPTLGPPPGEATGTIVAFEDPSCTRCRAFERQTMPRIESELVEPGKATFVFRGYPVVYAWGKPATQALEAVYARDETAHWTLKDHYFRLQDEFSASNVVERTHDFVNAETDLDADAVVADVESKAYDAQVQADLTAGDEGGAGGITPTVLLFRDGEYRTKARGSVSFSLVKSALGL